MRETSSVCFTPCTTLMNTVACNLLTALLVSIISILPTCKRTCHLSDRLVSLENSKIEGIGFLAYLVNVRPVSIAWLCAQ